MKKRFIATEQTEKNRGEEEDERYFIWLIRERRGDRFDLSALGISVLRKPPWSPWRKRTSSSALTDGWAPLLSLWLVAAAPLFPRAGHEDHRPPTNLRFLRREIGYGGCCVKTIDCDRNTSYIKRREKMNTKLIFFFFLVLSFCLKKKKQKQERKTEQGYFGKLTKISKTFYNTEKVLSFLLGLVIFFRNLITEPNRTKSKWSSVQVHHINYPNGSYIFRIKKKSKSNQRPNRYPN